MFTKLKALITGLLKKESTKIIKEVKETAGWEKYHKMMSSVSTGLEAKQGETVLPATGVNDQITDAVTQAAPKKPKAKKKQEPAPKMNTEPKKKPSKKK